MIFQINATVCGDVDHGGGERHMATDSDQTKATRTGHGRGGYQAKLKIQERCKNAGACSPGMTRLRVRPSQHEQVALTAVAGTLRLQVAYSITEMMSSMSVGILAFGSINEVPGPELTAVINQRIEVQTPFRVEFARSSRIRDGAPTLVPVSKGGAYVVAWVLVLDDAVTVAEACEMLYRRETGRLSDPSAGSRASWIAELEGFAGTSTCLYTALQANIRPLTAEKLAELALHSAVASSGAERRDGISYLHEQKRRGITTPLMSPYEDAVLAQTGAHDLDEAWARARSGAVVV